MTRDILVVLGVAIIVVGILGYFFYNVSKGVAPGLLTEKYSSGEEKVPTGTSKVTQTSKQTTQGKTQTKTSKGTGSSGAPDFASLFLKTKEFKATYDYYEKKTKKGELIYYLKGDKRRIDISTNQAKMINIYLKDKIIFCVKSAETQQQWVCYSMSPNQKPTQGQAGEGQNVEDPVEASQEFKKPVYNGTREIAGKQCHCYYVKTTENVEGKQASVTYEICLTTDGIFAYYYYKAVIGGNAKVYWVILKSYTTKVSDVAFNPPAPPQEFPSPQA